MTPDDPYHVLGVGRDASDDEIRAAFRAAIRRAHPDRSKAKADHQSITALTDAWRLLHDPVRRASFDEGDRPVARKNSPSDRWEPVHVHTSVLIKRLFLVTLLLTVVALSVLFLVAMAQSG